MDGGRRLTLVRYQQILSQVTLKESVKDWFGSRSLTIPNIMDAHFHVKKYHASTDFVAKFDLTTCDEETCTSLRTRFDNDGCKQDDYFREHEEENVLQSIFDDIHLSIYHSLQRSRKQEIYYKQFVDEKENKVTEQAEMVFEMGVRMHYHLNNNTKHKSLKDELKEWIDEETFWRCLNKCKKIMQTNRALKSANTNNDHYGFRFHHYIRIQHIMALHLYCGYPHLSNLFGKSLCPPQNQSDIHASDKCPAFYWFGRFLYEGMLY